MRVAAGGTTVGNGPTPPPPPPPAPRPNKRRALDAAKHALARAEAEREAAELKRHADLLAGRLEATIIALQALPPQLRRWGGRRHRC